MGLISCLTIIAQCGGTEGRTFQDMCHGLAETTELQIKQWTGSPLPDIKPFSLLAETGSTAEVDAKALWSRREESVLSMLVRHHIRY